MAKDNVDNYQSIDCAVKKLMHELLQGICWTVETISYLERTFFCLFYCPVLVCFQEQTEGRMRLGKRHTHVSNSY